MHKFRFHLSRIIRADFDPHRLDILFVSRYPTSPSEDRPIARSIARSLDRLLGRSLDRSVDRSVAQSVARSLGRSFGRSLSRSVHLPPCLSPSPYLVFPTLSPAYPHPSSRSFRAQSTSLPVSPRLHTSSSQTFPSQSLQSLPFYKDLTSLAPFAVAMHPPAPRMILIIFYASSVMKLISFGIAA